MTTYVLKYRDKSVIHEGFKTPWDTVYFKLINSENPEQVTKLKSFDVWCEIQQTNRTVALNVFDRTTGTKYKVDLWLRTKKRKNGVGDRVRYQVFELSSYYIKNSLKDILPKFEAEIEEHKNILKKEWDRQNNLRKKKELEEALKVRNITVEEYRKEKAEERRAARNKRTAGESVERTKRILALAPLLTNIRDEIDVVLKQFNEGRGEVGYIKNKIRHLHACMRVVKSLRTK